jgi:hypothetical protein
MKRIMTLLTLGLWVLCACKERSKDPKNGQDNGLQFSVDTAQLKHMDSMKAAQRVADSVLLQQANNTPGINAGAGHFEIGVPPGWRRVDTVLGNIRAVILDTPSTSVGFRTNVSIVSDSLRGLSVDDYLRGAIGSLAQYVPQFSLIGKGERTFGARSSRWLHYTQNRDGTQLEDICYFIPDKDVVYILTCSTLKGRLLGSYKAFERAVTSFSPSGR